MEENKRGRSLTKIIKTSSRGRKKPKAFSETSKKISITTSPLNYQLMNKEFKQEKNEK